MALSVQHRLPIIADEIYGNLVFASTGAKFHPLAGLSKNVPVIAAGGIAKEFLVPGCVL
jgi:tyrosine aminotransferase